MYKDAVRTLDGSVHFPDGQNELKNKIVELMIDICSFQQKQDELKTLQQQARKKQDDLMRKCVSLLENELKHE